MQLQKITPVCGFMIKPKRWLCFILAFFQTLGSVKFLATEKRHMNSIVKPRER